MGKTLLRKRHGGERKGTVSMDRRPRKTREQVKRTDSFDQSKQVSGLRKGRRKFREAAAISNCGKSEGKVHYGLESAAKNTRPTLR